MTHKNYTDPYKVLADLAQDAGLRRFIDLREGGYSNDYGMYHPPQPRDARGGHSRVRLVFNGPTHGASDPIIPSAQVNWSAIGASEPDKAEVFAAKLEAVAKAAKRWNDLRSEYLDAYREAIKHQEAQHQEEADA